MINWINTVYKGGAVRRFHTVPVTSHETVAEHSFGVAVMVLALTNNNASKNLMLAALFHDLAEQVTGDIPATAKWNHPTIKVAAQVAEHAFHTEHGLTVDLSEREQLILKWADLLQLMFYCKAQRDLGNKNMNPVFARVVEFLGTMENLPAGQKMLNWLVENYSA